MSIVYFSKKIDKDKSQENFMEKSKVYFSKEITPDSLVKMFEVLNKPLAG